MGAWRDRDKDGFLLGPEPDELGSRYQSVTIVVSIMLNMDRRLIGRYLVADPKICHGKLTFAGTRVPVETVLHFLSKGKSMDAILADWPELTAEAVAEAIELAAAALNKQAVQKAYAG